MIYFVIHRQMIKQVLINRITFNITKEQKERYNNMTLTELYASQGITLVDKFGE